MVGRSLTGIRPQSIEARGQFLLVVSLLVITIAAWAVTIYQARTMEMPMGVAVRGVTEPAGEAMESMPGMTMDGVADATMGGMSGMGWTWDGLLTFVIAWAVMMAAMMFPAAAPMLLLYHAIARKRLGSGGTLRQTWIFAFGYLAVWTAIGLGAWVLVQAASELASRLGDAARETWAPLALGAVLVGAGAYQFTALKAICLRQCQMPIGFLMTHWRDGNRGAWRMGLSHGAYCLGCCWTLFAVLVATGVMSLAWMLLLTLVVAVEKLLPLGPRATYAIGAAFVALGAFVAAGAADLPWTT